MRDGAAHLRGHRRQPDRLKLLDRRLALAPDPLQRFVLGARGDRLRGLPPPESNLFLTMELVRQPAEVVVGQAVAQYPLEDIDDRPVPSREVLGSAWVEPLARLSDLGLNVVRRRAKSGAHEREDTSADAGLSRDQIPCPIP